MDDRARERFDRQVAHALTTLAVGILLAAIGLGALALFSLQRLAKPGVSEQTRQ